MNKPQGNMFAQETLVNPFEHYRQMHEAGIQIEHIAEMNTYVV